MTEQNEQTNQADAARAVLVERHAGWAEVILNRPERRNAMEGVLVAQLRDAVRALSADPEIRAIVLRGAGGSFCSGLDLKAFNVEPQPAWVPGFRETMTEAHQALFDCTATIIVAMERFAINGGSALAFAGDLMICGESGYVHVGEAQVGMAAPNNLVWIKLRYSESVAARLALMAQRVPAQELLRLGVAHEVVPDDQVVKRACELAAQLAAYPAGATARLKADLRSLGHGASARDWFAAIRPKDAPKPRAV